MAAAQRRCPICRKEVAREGNQWWPFCSERCELIDLGRWATEAYRIPGETAGTAGAAEDEQKSASNLSRVDKA